MGDFEDAVDDVVDTVKDVTLGGAASDLVNGLFGGGGGSSDVNVTYPAPTAEETALVAKQTQWIDTLMGELGKESELEKKQTEYFTQLTESQTLSSAEEAAFEKEFNLQKSALMEQFSIETGRAGASRYAEMVSRGVADSSTGINIERDAKLKESDALSSALAEMGLSKETAKSDFEMAKQQMALQGYKLTSSLMQDRVQQALDVSTNLQNYYTGNRSMQANVALQNAVMKQSAEQQKYQNRMGIASIGTAVGLSLL